MSIFVIIALILFFIVTYNKMIEPNKFIKDARPVFNFLLEPDYAFLLKLRYGTDIDIEKMFSQRLNSALLVAGLSFVFMLGNFSFLYFMIVLVIFYAVYKQPYNSLRTYYKKNLHYINLLLPYYLKSLEILVQHYTVPVALSRSIGDSPEVFRPGLRDLVKKIEAGNMSVDPYMEFAKTYPVRDSMRMMRLLYRLSLGSQAKKQEQLMLFSKTVSNLQNKAREQKYAERLGIMEQKTMIMLMGTGGGVMFVMLLSMMMMMNF